MKIKKRNRHVGIIAAIAIILSVGCSSEKKDTLYLFNWTYYTPESVIELFEEEFNVNVRIDNYASNEEMYTKIKAGATGYDIVFPSQDYVTIMLKQDMFEKLDLTQLPNTANINPAVLEKATYDPTMQYSVPYGMTVAGIAVNNEKVTDYEKSWNIFEREDLKNRMSMLDDMREVMGAALIYLGYSTDTVDDGELAEAEELLKTKWTPNLVKFDAEGFGKSFASGDFWVSHGYAEVVFGEVPEEKWHTIDYFIPEEGAPLYIDSMCILKGSKNYDLALQFIDFIHRPEIYALFLDEFQFPPVINTEAAQFVTTTPMYEIDDISGYEIPGDLAENISKYNNIWERIRFAN